VDSNFSAYITGSTAGSFPTSNAEQPAFGGGDGDAFAVKLTASGAVVYSTYLGGPAADLGQRIKVDGTGAAYITGFRLVSPFQGTFGGGTDAFLAELSPPELSSIRRTSVEPVRISAKESPSTIRARFTSPDPPTEV
jgi:hypothetical protein